MYLKQVMWSHARATQWSITSTWMVDMYHGCHTGWCPIHVWGVCSTQLLAKKIIQRSSNQYASPGQLVRKKIGGLRMCVDYRLLNRYVTKDAYPLLRIGESMHAWLFGTLDLQSAYYLVVVAEDKANTPFCTPVGLLGFNKLPFGLPNGQTNKRCHTPRLSSIQHSYTAAGITQLQQADLVIFAVLQFQQQGRCPTVEESGIVKESKSGWTSSIMWSCRMDWLIRPPFGQQESIGCNCSHHQSCRSICWTVSMEEWAINFLNALNSISMSSSSGQAYGPLCRTGLPGARDASLTRCHTCHLGLKWKAS